MVNFFSNKSKSRTDGQRLITNYMILSVLTNSMWMFTDGIFVLFLLDKVGFVTTSTLLSIQFITQALLDYPTGAFADWVGHKIVLLLSFVLFGISFILLGLFSVINPSSIFSYFLLIMIIRSIAAAQQSGSLQAWYDNHYKQILDTTDPDKRQYGSIFGKSILVNRLASFVFIMFSGYLASTYSREFLFRIQILFIIIGIGLIIALMSDFGVPTRNQIKISEYRKLLLDGVKVAFRNYSVFYLTLAYLTIIVILNIYGFIFLFPIYYGYSGSDHVAYSLRGIIFLLGVIMVIAASVMSKKMEPRDWLVKVSMAYTFIWNGFFLLLLWYFPLSILEREATYNFRALVFLVLLGVLMAFLSTLWLILYQRIVVDEIPDENRNSYYSLIPTLGMLLSALMFPSIGKYINNSQNFLYPFMIFISLICLVSLIFTYLSKYCFTNVKCQRRYLQGTA